MSVRFVVGRAGSGKTFRCLEAIRARLREGAAEAIGPAGSRSHTEHGAENGPAGSRSHTEPPTRSHTEAGGRSHNKLLLIVPEQASFQMERALIETPDIPAFTRCEVLSFQRLAYRVFAETGADPRRGDQTIGGFGRMMVIRRLIRREQAGLRMLGSVADKPGLIGQLSRTVDELMREEVEPTALTAVAERIEATDPLGAAKLADVARLYQAYLDYLVGDRIDPAQYLQLAADRLDGVGWLAGAEVWVDGFAGFTRQEYHLLAELARRVAGVEVTMLVEPDASAVEAADVPVVSYSRFARAERTLTRLRRELRSRGVEIGEPLRLRSQPGASRFAHPELASLEKSLFVGSDDGTEAKPTSGASVIRVLEFPDRRAEVEAAIAEVQRLTRMGTAGEGAGRYEGAGGTAGGGAGRYTPMRYRDIAIIVRDLGAYGDLMSAAMRSRNIPCFIDRRQPTTHHPLVELVRGLLAMAADDCRLESVRLTLKTGLLPLDAGDVDLLENYLIAHGIEGRSRWAKDWTYTRFFARRSEDDELSADQRTLLARINSLRARWYTLVERWLGLAAGRAETTGQAWATALFACLERLEAGRRLDTWAQAAADDGQTDLAEMHRQVWTDFIELLDEFVRALGDEPMRVAEFRETMEAGLAEFSLGLAPPALDQVLVGAVERSRHPEVRAVLLLGFDEAHYPMRRAEDPLLGDAEREAMRQANAEIGPSRGQRLVEERMLAYIALTRASERVWIGYPRQEADGKPLQPSAYLRDVLDAVPGLQVERVADVETARSAEWVTDVGQLGGRLAREFRYRARLTEEPDAAARATWNAIYEAARSRPGWRHTLLRRLAGLRYANVAALQPGLIERAVELPFAASVSRLEGFAACPFRHYAEYLLRLEERVEAETNQIDLGKLCHAILEKFVDELAGEKRRLADLEDDDIRERVDRIAGEVLPAVASDLMLEDARSEFLFDRSRGHLSRVTRWQREFARRGRFRPAAAEFPFGYRRRPDAVVRVRTPKGRDVLLRGRIDRVDVAELGGDLVGLVIDYKRSHDRRLSLIEVYHGLALQLVGYLLALRQIGRSLAGRAIRPVAALYLPLLEPYQTVTHPQDEKARPHKCRGVLDTSVIGAIDDSITPGGGGSAFVAARLKKDGAGYANSDLAEASEVSALIAHVERRMGQLADDLIDGNVKVAPYRLNRHMPCSFCPYQAVCRYEIETQAPRRLESMARADVLARIVEETSDSRAD